MGKGIMKGLQPLPDGHPFKGGRIIFGAKRPGSSAKPSTKEEEAPSTKSSPEEEDKSFDIAAHRSLEASLMRRLTHPMDSPGKDPSQSSDTDTESPSEAPSPDTSTEQE